MAVIHIESIRQAVNKGTLIELADDYRTSRTIRACLPWQTSYPFAISTTAYSQEVQSGTVGDRHSRMDAIGVFLGKFVGHSGNPSPADLELKFPGQAGSTARNSLKLEWFAPNKYWVILLPHEQLQQVLKSA